MAEHLPAVRQPSRRPILAERQPKAAPVQPTIDLFTASFPKLPHHDSLKPEGVLSSRAQRPSQGPALENKRLSTIADDASSDPKRNSAISTTSTASGKSKRKTHVGPWQLGRTLGKGATGRVRLAKHAFTGQVAAIKIVSKKSAALVQSASIAQMDKDAASPPSAAGFRLMPFGIEREVVIMKLIEHPNVINLYDVWENRGELYLVLEYVEGGELFDYVSSHGALSEEEAVRLFRQIIAGLSCCHRYHICHRDLKPENLLLDAQRNVKLADFGMAALQPADRWLNTSCGSPHYAAPEIIDGKRYRGDKADIWSVGIILYAMLNGFLPFDGGNLTATLRLVKRGEYHLSKALSEEASDLIQQILQKRPEDRISIKHIWAHPLLKKYERYHQSLAPNGVLVGPPPPLSAKDCGAPIRRRGDIDFELLRNLRSLWYGVTQEDLITRLLSAEPNHEKLFYNSLIKFREEQLENYPGAPLEYSASDYHHVPKPFPILASTPTQGSPVQSLKHTRQRSQFSIVTEGSARRDTYYKDPITATSATAASTTTRGSYDPYRSSRAPLDSSRAEHATVVMRRGSGASRARRPSHAAELRSVAISRLQHQSPVHPKQSSRDHSRTRQRRGSSTGYSRSSLTSVRRGEGIIRKSTSYKRQVSFHHTRHRSPGYSSRTLYPPCVGSSDVGSVKGSDFQCGLLESQSTPSLPSPPRVQRPRKPASELDIKKGRVTNNHWREEARKVSSELGKICEEAFNRSSVSSSDASPVKDGDSPATSVSVPAGDFTTLGTDHFNDRPLPQPPAESPDSYTLRELAETRRRLLKHCQYAATDAVPEYLSDVVAHLDRLMQAASSSNSRWDVAEKRSASDPSSTIVSKSILHATATNEGRLGMGASEVQASRSASDSARFTRQGIIPPTGKTVRLVSPEASSYHQLPSIPPLNIRKKSAATMNPFRYGSKESARSAVDQIVSEPGIRTGLDTIDEHPHFTKSGDPAKSPVVGRKWSWFRRQSDPLDEAPPTPPKKNSPIHVRKESVLEEVVSHTISHSSEAQNGTAEIMCEPSGEVGPTTEMKRRWLSKMFARTGKGNESSATNHMVVHDMASETDSNATSSENLVAEPRGRQSGKHRALSTGESEPYARKQVDGTMTDATAATRPTQAHQNWFARFFHVKPASRVICLCVGKAKARKEIIRTLKEWRKYGVRDVISERSEGGDSIRARVDQVNYLHLKSVEFHAELFTVLEHGCKCNLSVIRFIQERGAASSFQKVVDTLEAVLKQRNFLVMDTKRKRGIEKSMKESDL